jgi:hypothetical protein
MEFIPDCGSVTSTATLQGENFLYRQQTTTTTTTTTTTNNNNNNSILV